MSTRMHIRRIRRYTHWILIFGCLAYMTVPIFILTHRYHEIFNKNEIKVNIYESGLQVNNHKGAISAVTVKENKSGINQIQKTSAFSDTSLHENNAFVSLTTGRHYPLRRWNPSHPIVFLHIGKNGGTSFDVTVGPIVRKLSGHYMGHRHFDWSYIETLVNPDVVLLLRDPVARAVSHFHFTKKRRIFIITVSLSEYLRNPQNLLEARDIWQDGQAAVMWLTGTHVANWVGIKRDEIPEREIKFLDHKTMCLKAAARLKETLWFGFLDDQERSFDMLQWQLGYEKKIKLTNANKTPHADITAEDKAILQSLMPLDLWLYEYAKILFDARWEQYKTGVYSDPKLPPLPEINCKSTRYILACNDKSPLGPLYHVWNATAETEEQIKLLPKEEWTKS